MYTKGLVVGSVVSLLTIGSVVSWIVLHENRTPASLFTTNTGASVEESNKVSGSSNSSTPAFSHEKNEEEARTIVDRVIYTYTNNLKPGMTQGNKVTVSALSNEYSYVFDLSVYEGNLIYTTTEKDTKENRVFIDNKQIAKSDLDIQYILGKATYIIHDEKTDTDSLYVMEDLIAKADEIRFEPIAGKLFYYTYDKKTDTYTLYYDGQMLAKHVSERPFRHESVYGKIAYATTNDTTEKTAIYYDGKEYFSTTDEVGIGFFGVGGKLAVELNGKDQQIYIDGAKLPALEGKEIGGKLAYTTRSDQGSISLYYDQKLISSNNYISFEEVDGKLAYKTCDKSKCSLYFDGKLTEVPDIDTLTKISKNEPYIQSNSRDIMRPQGTLYYDNKVVADINYGETLIIAGKLAYTDCKILPTTGRDPEASCDLYYDGKKIDSGKNISISEITSKLVYLTYDEGEDYVTVHHDGISTKAAGYMTVQDIYSVGGNLVYTSRDLSSTTEGMEYLYFNDKLVTSAPTIHLSTDAETELVDYGYLHAELQQAVWEKRSSQEKESFWAVTETIGADGKPVLTPYFFK